MRVLHTSDWHLGIRFLGKNRDEEHRKVLAWMLELIERENIDLLIIAGDVFDSPNPSNAARKIYFDFLKKLIKSKCTYAVIVGGNHDSPSMLDAPSAVLEMLDIHVVGAAKRNDVGDVLLEKEIIELKNDNGKLEAVVGAVPFLRDRDLIFGDSAQTFDERVSAVKEGISGHYNAICELVGENKDVPVFLTGHLFATGASTSDGSERQEGENDIHVGNLARVSLASAADVADYVALGHIHKPQRVGGKDTIRYSGSILPISFSERNDQKSVVIVDAQAGQVKCELKEIPSYVNLIRFKGTASEVESKVSLIEHDNEVDVWGEIVFTERVGAVTVQKCKEVAEQRGIEILKIRFDIELEGNESDMSGVKQLEELSVDDIFQLRCKDENFSEDELRTVEETFLELKDWMVNADE